MAKPYLIFKAHTGFYYAQIHLADGSLSNNISTNIPVRVNSKDSKVQSIDKIRVFNDLRTADFDTEDIETIIKILKDKRIARLELGELKLNKEEISKI